MAKRKRSSPWSDPGTAYALAALNGEIVTGRLVKLAAERHLRDLERWHPKPDGPNDLQHGYVPAFAEYVERFAVLLKHFKGRWAGEPITFEPWEQFCVYSIFGWLRLNSRGKWVRRHRAAYVQVARKNGKSTLLSALGNYLFTGDGESASEVYCLDPATPVLRSDLRWVPVGAIAAGDRLVAFDEDAPGRGSQRKYRIAAVTATARRILPCCRVTFDDGRSVISSHDHLWLCSKGSTADSKKDWIGSNKDWYRTDRLTRGRLVRSLGMPWVEESTREAGYLAGIYDGEGCFGSGKTRTTSAGFRVSFAQKPGLVLTKTRRLLEERGFRLSPNRLHKSGVVSVDLQGAYQCMRFLGQMRPVRLLPKFEAWIEDRAANKGNGYARVVDVEFVGDREVVALETTTGTLFANGLFSHNSAATKLDQARIIHETAIEMMRRSPFVPKDVKILKFNMHEVASASKFEPLGADSKTLDGLNPHGALIDEYHAHPDAGLYNVLNTGMGAREQPLLAVITTAGDNLDSPCGRERDYAIKVLEGTHTDETYFAYVAELDPADDPADESVWIKGNPSLHVTVEMDELRAEYNKAKEDPSKYGDFLRKRLNMWLETSDSWIAFDAMERWWRSCAGPLPLEALKGRICYGGLDLATIKDLTAFALLFPPGDGLTRWTLLLKLWCPEIGLADRVKKDRVPYDMWLQRGWLKATEGNRIDYGVVKADILALGGLYKVQSVGYDPWNSEMLTQELVNEGLNMVEMRQNFRDLSQPMKQLEALILDSALSHGDNEAFRWMLSNMATRTDDNGNCAPSKKKATERIDGVVAAIMAIGRATRAEAPRRSRYEEEGAEVASFQL